MLEDYRQPRWGVLYLALPLSGALFWLIQQVHPSTIVRTLLDLAALVVVGAFVEGWRLANRLALLHHPRTGNDREPIYYVREAAGSHPAGPGRGVQAVFVADSYSDLFSLPVQVGEPSPSLEELSPLEGRERKQGSEQPG